MTLKQRLVKIIRSIDNPEILQGLLQWLEDRLQQTGNPGETQEKNKTYTADNNTSGKNSDDEVISTVTIRASHGVEIVRLVKLAEQLGLEYNIESVEPVSETESDALEWLEKIARQGGVKGIEDPVDWQKKERRDRMLP